MTTSAPTPDAGTADLRNSRIGKRPIALPKGCSATIKDGSIEVKGPKGTLSRVLPEGVSARVEGGAILITPTVPGRDGPRIQGLAWALVGGMVKGVSEGYVRTLQLVGTGYRAEVKGQMLNLSLGFSHPIAFPLPQGVKCEIPGDSKGTIVILSGSDKERMGQTAAKIRGFRPPEPYGGKGVRYQGEKVREKAGKAAKAGGGK
jgi:large subunit ribosomal protein L6